MGLRQDRRSGGKEGRAQTRKAVAPQNRLIHLTTYFFFENLASWRLYFSREEGQSKGDIYYKAD